MPTSSRKSPAFQFYPGDWRRDMALQRCSLRARGFWLELMCLMHDGTPYGHLATEQGPITDLRVIARLVGGTPREVALALEELDSGGVCSRTAEGVLYSRRMVRDEALRQQRKAWGALSIGHPATHPPRDPSRAPSTVPFAPPPASAVASAVLPTPRLSRKKDSELSGWRPTACELLTFLNEKTGRSYRPVGVNLDLIVARLKDGATPANIRGVIARKVREWHGTEFEKFLRPATLFNRTKFEQYLGERAPEASHADVPTV